MIQTFIHKRPLLFYTGILFLLSMLLYANTLNHSFAFDDKSLIIENTYLDGSVDLSRIFTTSYRSGVGFTGDGLYRPLVILSFALNNIDRNPFYFHIVNVLINAVNAVLLFLLLRIITGNMAVSFTAALLWSVNPIHTEAVANIAGRPELLYTLFLLSSWLLFTTSDRSLYNVLPASVCFIAALLSKETAIILPFLVAATDAIQRKYSLNKKNILKYVLIFLVLSLYFLIRFSVLGGLTGDLIPEFVDNPAAHVSTMSRIATALAILVRYIMLMILPFRLSSDYSYNHIPVSESIIGLLPIIGLFLLVGLCATAVYTRRRKTAIFLGVILLLLPWLPVSNLPFAIGTIMGERLMYLPLAGISLIAAVFLMKLILTRRTFSIVVISIIVVTYSSLTISRNRAWRDDYTLFSTDVQVKFPSVKVLYNMAYLAKEREQYKEAEHFYRQALDVYPAYTVASKGLGKLFYDMGNYEESELNYQIAVSQEPDNPEYLTDYAIVLEKLKKYDDAEKYLEQSLKINPKSPKTLIELGNIALSRSEFLDAISYFRDALKYGGDRRILLNNLAVTLFYAGDYRGSYTYVQKARKSRIQMNPEFLRALQQKLSVENTE